MKKTRICEVLNIQYPILQGGMLWIADAGLAAAVSNAGGLGVISPMAGMKPHGNPVKNLDKEITKAKKLTDRPFGVNVPLDLRDCDLIMNVIIEQQVPVVITAAGDPSVYTELLKSVGANVIHVVSSVKHAKSAEKAGVDAVVCEGVEAAARNGFDELPLFSLVPQAADAVKIPIIAAGGIADGRGVVAAFALGAEGVQMGTRFVAVKESIAHRHYKDAIVAAGDTDTIITLRPLIPSRSLKNTEFTQTLIAMEQSGASVEELREFLGHAASRRAGLEGDLDSGEAYCGSSAGLIHEILTAGEVIKNLVEGYPAVLRKL